MAGLRQQVMQGLQGMVRGEPGATPGAVFAAVDAAEPPLRLLLGNQLPRLRETYAERLQGWEAWEDVSLAAWGR